MTFVLPVIICVCFASLMCMAKHDVDDRIWITSQAAGLVYLGALVTALVLPYAVDSLGTENTLFAPFVADGYVPAFLATALSLGVLAVCLGLGTPYNPLFWLANFFLYVQAVIDCIMFWCVPTFML